MSPFSPRLRRFGPTNWEGWFLIAVAGRGQAVRWTKTHLFRSAPPRGFHPLSEFEGLSSPGELVTYIATADSIREQRDEIATDDPGIAGQGFGIDLDDLAWQGEPPRYTFARSMDDGVRVDLQVETRDRVDWVRLPGLINYFVAPGHGGEMPREQFGPHRPIQGGDLSIQQAKSWLLIEKLLTEANDECLRRGSRFGVVWQGLQPKLTACWQGTPFKPIARQHGPHGCAVLDPGP